MQSASALASSPPRPDAPDLSVTVRPRADLPVLTVPALELAEPPEPTVERDRRTLARLLTAVPGAVMLDFDPAWWDGAAHLACLLARVDGRRRRIVETQGVVLVLPGNRRAARRALQRWRGVPAGAPLAPRRGVGARLLRRPVASIVRSVPLAPGAQVTDAPVTRLAGAVPGQLDLFTSPRPVPLPRHPMSGAERNRIVVLPDLDVQRCRYANCGGLSVVGRDDTCPVCHRV